MACFERASPALKEILLKLYRAEKPPEIEQSWQEFGSLQYHVQSSASDTHNTYLSISTPILSQGTPVSSKLSNYTMKMVKEICSEVVEIVEPAREGYQLTLRLDFTKIPQKKDAENMITEISSVQAVILSSQLREIIWNVNSLEVSEGMYKPIKLVYHPREPFYVVKQPEKLTAVFPMRFKEDSDVIIATAFFQELMDVGNSKAYAKAPPCNWSPIPPPQLRGEYIEDLSTNGGFVSFEIFSRHVEGKKLDKTVWTLLNFYALVKYHVKEITTITFKKHHFPIMHLQCFKSTGRSVKCTRGFIQRRMRSRLESLVEGLQNTSIEDDTRVKKVKGFKYMKKLVNFSRLKFLRRRWNLTHKIKRIHSRLKIHGFGRFRRRWLTIPKFSSITGYTKLE